MSGKLYTLGILRSLNSRPDLRGRMTSDDIGRRSLSDWQWGDQSENTVSRRWSEVRTRSCSHPDVRVLFGGTETEMSCAPVNTDVVPVTGIVAGNYASWPKVVGLARK